MAKAIRIEKHLPNLFTLGNLFCGFMGILFCGMGDIPLAAEMIFVGALFDVGDGLAARLFKAHSPIGGQLDSLADCVTFGVLPGLILHNMIQHFSTQEWIHVIDIAYFPIGSLIPFLTVAGAVWRLAKFNLDAEQAKYFKGLPSPASAMFIAALPLIAEYNVFFLKNNTLYLAELVTNTYLLLGVSVILPLLMISNLPLFSLKMETYGFAENKVLYLFLMVSAALLALLWWAAIPVILILYIIVSIIIKPAQKHHEIQS
ncbi:MAG: CDP-alcohol phosphatidyltransferase family protein [Bacteroidetes bacterium]|nr:CDP-alcohol phosphatidyltransferase family protein [Bacteroidota bacterium]